MVTGAATGIGAAIVTLLAREGAHVLAVDIDGDALRHDLPGITNCVCDVTSAAQVEAMVQAVIDTHGRLDMLFNNAGVGALCDVAETDDDTWDKVFRVNITAVMYGCRAAVPHMRQAGGGAIVNTASISGMRGDYGYGPYNAAKGAVINYTRSLALDLGRDKIRVNALCPGFIANTRLTATLEKLPQRREWDESIPLGRAGTADEMAKVAAFLASDDASYVTGAILAADGGVTAHTGQVNIHSVIRKMTAEGTYPASRDS
ncbi:3-oxoacyl-ACP reductase (plasmid) [Novosphingobium pentaromativorans US6-1]|nr:3-oxoacyl-ACP reductase [Novosphingobium pentaromativorans US6-1]